MSDTKSHYVTIIAALIGVVGTLGAVLLEDYISSKGNPDEKQEQHDRTRNNDQNTKDDTVEEKSNSNSQKDTSVDPPEKNRQPDTSPRSITPNNASKKKSEPPITQPPSSKDYVVDPDGQRYKIIRLVGKTWMAENLNYYVTGSYCYDNDMNKCNSYGKLYTWEAARAGCRALGNGWRLPEDKEWGELTDFYGYRNLIKGGSSNFNVLLGGYRYTDGSFLYLGANGLYWSATATGEGDAYDYYFVGDNQGLGRNYNSQSNGFSVRCLQD